MEFSVLLLLAGVWYFVNGVLHDVFVLVKHKTGYDRELLRLLMDGHVLMLSGALCIFGSFMPLEASFYTAVLGFITGIFMLGYCIMIWPFLKSVMTTIISLGLTVLSVYQICLWY